MDKYDIAIIGTGPAGLEAAITSKIRNKKILLLGERNLSRKVEKAPIINNYLGLTAISGEELKNAFQKHLYNLDISITEDKVNAIYSMGNYFSIQGRNSIYEALTVILACGMSVINPFSGEIENLGRGVSYCVTCDALFYKGKSAVVIGYSKKEEKEVEFLSEIADKVYYLPMYKDEVSLNNSIEIKKNKKLLLLKKKKILCN